MKALQINEYGDASKLKIAEIEKPLPKDDQVLLKVKAAGINPIDMKFRAGMFKEMMPKSMPMGFGWEASGIIDASLLPQEWKKCLRK